MNIFKMKRGDTSPSLRYQLPDDATLAGAQVRFQMRRAGGEMLVDVAATIESSADPAIVRHDWQSSQTDLAGRYEAEFRVQFADGSVETFPNRDFILIIINPDIR